MHPRHKPQHRTVSASTQHLTNTNATIWLALCGLTCNCNYRPVIVILCYQYLDIDYLKIKLSLGGMFLLKLVLWSDELILWFSNDSFFMGKCILQGICSPTSFLWYMLHIFCVILVWKFIFVLDFFSLHNHFSFYSVFVHLKNSHFRSYSVLVLEIMSIFGPEVVPKRCSSCCCCYQFS